MADRHPIEKFIFDQLTRTPEGPFTLKPPALREIRKAFRGFIDRQQGDAALDGIFVSIGVLEQARHKPAANALKAMLQDMRGRRQMMAKEIDQRLDGKASFNRFTAKEAELPKGGPPAEGSVKLDDLGVPKKI